MMINTQEYQQRLEDLQHGLISTEEWMAYCASIRKSIVVDTSHAKDINNSTPVEHQENIPGCADRALV
jgi:hypothetical protein